MSGPKQGAYNVNVGVLGHVDSGKTSLDTPAHLRGLNCDKLQVTLVDCPGHASLIRTIIGGAQIIDIMMLIVDITKGIQAQTAECLVVGEVATNRLLVVLNKVDLLPPQTRDKAIIKAQRMLLKTFAHTKFGRPPIVSISSKPGGGGEFTEGPSADPVQVRAVMDGILALISDKPRQVEGPFLMSVDHCFAVKGHGTVLTGTVLKGSAKINDTIELPRLKEQKKIKSLQIFKKSQQQCHQGDRVGICVTQLDPARVERGWLSTPGTVPTFTAAIAALEKIRFYTSTVKTKQKLHATVGHVTVMAEMQFFGLPDGEGEHFTTAGQAITSRLANLSAKDSQVSFDFQREYLHQDELYGLEGRPLQGAAEGPQKHYGAQWGLLKFSQPVTAPKDSLVIISRLDEASTGRACRLALYGRLAGLVDPNSSTELKRLKVYKIKQKEGSIERLLATDGSLAVCRGFFKKESDFSAFIGLQVKATGGEIGQIESTFGKSGKFRVRFQKSIPVPLPENYKLTLTFKKFVSDKDQKRILQ